MPKYDNDFFTDILEAIEHLEKSLLDYDEILSKNENNPAQIHIIFKNAHNLKGILALAQLENSQSLIHIIEDNFDQIRNGKALVSSDLVDKSLKALDLITKSISQGKEDPEDFLELRQALEPSGKIAESEPILPFELSSKEKDTALLSCKGEYGFFIIEKLIKTSIDKENYSNLPIFQDIKEIGSLIGFRPKWEELNKKSEDDVIRIFFIIFDPLKTLDKNKICNFLSNTTEIDKVEQQIEVNIEIQKQAPENLKDTISRR